MKRQKIQTFERTLPESDCKLIDSKASVTQSLDEQKVKHYASQPEVYEVKEAYSGHEEHKKAEVR